VTSAWAEAWVKITEYLKSGQVKPNVARTFPLEAAAAALRHLVEDRPFGRVLLKI
jgi:NADPH2:quinone reductase